MFEPAHGSSPKYRGQDKVDPVATILSGAWLLSYIGEETQSKAIFESTRYVIEETKTTTYDLGGSAKTSEMAAAIATQVRQSLK